VIKLRLTLEVAVPFTSVILLGNKLFSEAISKSLASSSFGITMLKIPFSESNIATPCNSSSNGREA